MFSLLKKVRLKCISSDVFIANGMRFRVESNSIFNF